MHDRRRRHAEQLRNDQDVLRRGARQIRRLGRQGRTAGLSDPATADRLAETLELFAEHLATLDLEVRRHACRVAAELVGSGMDRPAVRRTRRRG